MDARLGSPGGGPLRPQNVNNSPARQPNSLSLSEPCTKKARKSLEDEMEGAEEKEPPPKRRTLGMKRKRRSVLDERPTAAARRAPIAGGAVTLAPEKPPTTATVQPSPSPLSPGSASAASGECCSKSPPASPIQRIPNEDEIARSPSPRPDPCTSSSPVPNGSQLSEAQGRPEQGHEGGRASGEGCQVQEVISEAAMAKLPYLQKLDPAQRRVAVARAQCPLVVIAGPGSGKTTTMMARRA
jgi:hypothetical protein